MKENNQSRIFLLLGEVLIAALLSAGLTVISAQSAGIGIDAGLVYLSAGIFALALFGLSYSRASGWITLLLMVLAAFVSVLFGWKPIEDVKVFLDAAYMGESLEVYKDAFAVSVLILLMAAFYIMAHQRAGAYLMLFVTIALLGVLWFFGDVSASIHILPVILALSAMFSKTARFKFSALRPLMSLSLVAAILACMLVPARGVKIDALNDYAQKALAFMIRTFNIDNKNLEERRSFTIAANGWASHKELIGGNAYPSEGEVMKITGEPGEIYLRGAIRYVYNNNAWVDESNESKAGKIKRYMFSGFEKLIYKSEYERAMDLDKKSSNAYFEDASFSVEMLDDTSFWTLYTPSRVTDVHVNTDAFVYFNNVGEIFINRQMRQGDAFEIEYVRLNVKEEEIPEMIRSLEKVKDDGYKNAFVLNKGLPEKIDGSVYETAYRITQNALSPYDKAAAIRDYLKMNGKYTLISDYPPEGKDAVSFFMNEGMEGYCVHFASAMTVMCRIVGLPARYVEGYLCTIDENGEGIVTGLDAHAWTEVYLNGYGWMTFDATPPDADEDDNTENSEGQAPPDDGNAGHTQDEMGDDPLENDPPTAPTPTPTPEPTPSPTPETDDGASTDENDLFADPTPTPTPPAGDSRRNNSESDQNDSDNENDQNKPEDETKNAIGKIILLIVAIILILLALCAFVYLRLYKTAPERMTQRERNSEDKLMFWYRAMLTALEASLIRYEAGETPMTFAQRALERKACNEEFLRFSAIVAKRRYSESEAMKEDFGCASNAYRAIVHLMRIPARIRWYLRRIMQGIGHVNQVP